MRGDAQEPLGFVGGWRDVQAEVELRKPLTSVRVPMTSGTAQPS